MDKRQIAALAAELRTAIYEAKWQRHGRCACGGTRKVSITSKAITGVIFHNVPVLVCGDCGEEQLLEGTTGQLIELARAFKQASTHEVFLLLPPDES